MIHRVTIKNFKRFREQVFDLQESVVLAGPNNAGKSTLLQALSTWKFAVDRWNAQRAGGRAVKRSGVAIMRSEITSVPLREMNLMWEDRRVTDSRGMSGPRRLIEIVVEGKEDGKDWDCGIEIQYDSSQQIYARPRDARNLDLEDLRNFPPQAVKELNIVHVPPLSGIERDEPLHQRGMQDMFIGQGRPGEILRNLLWEITQSGDERGWTELTNHVRSLFNIDLQKPNYSPAQPYIVCEYREEGHSRPLDLSNAGSGTLQVLLLFAFLYARPATVILLDEPDAHQHVILQKQLYDLIRRVARERGSQVIVATHSEVVLDATEPERVIGFFDNNEPRALTSETERDGVREALKRLTSTQLLLARTAGAVLYVEGETDERILKEWARILDHPAMHFFKRPCIHRLRGRSLREAKGHYFAMKAAFPDIPALCLLDGDNRDEPDEEMTKVGLGVLRWQRYEIENYLLQPEAIKRFLNFPLMNEEVNEAFQKQVPLGTDPFGDHVSLTRVKASDEFLTPLLRDLGRPVPKKDLYQLAAAMNPDEIHPEVREKLDHIAKTLNPGAGR